VLCTVNMLAIDLFLLDLDTVIELMKCFPCLEKLYIQVTIIYWHSFLNLINILTWSILFRLCSFSSLYKQRKIYGVVNIGILPNVLTSA
jgi:hypothetical protein